MGTFDSVYANCPGCDAQVEFQSKVGDCRQKRYHHRSVPPVIACDLNGAKLKCPKCGHQVELTMCGCQTRARMEVNHLPEGFD